MIDLTYTREQMLADIGVTEASMATCLYDASDPRFSSCAEVQLIIKDKTPAHLLPILNAAFERRYAAVPSEQLFRDLIYPLKKGVGNAYKRGNCYDDAKQVTVNTVATRSGAVIAIADEGDGFDFVDVLNRFKNNERYFTYRGSGFDQFQKAQSVINYAHGGRTLHIRFLCTRQPGRPLTPATSVSFGPAGDMAFMKTFLAQELPELQLPDVSLESCHTFLPNSPKKSPWDIAYVLEYGNGRTNKTQETTLSGRILPQVAAQTEFKVTKQLHHLANADLHIPRPVAILESPPMPLFKFLPAQDLRRHMRKLSPEDVSQLQTRIGSGLKALHQSAIKLERTIQMADVLLQQQAIKQHITQKLAQTSPQRIVRVEQFCSTLSQQAVKLRAYEPTPIHGAFGWNCILQHEGNFYFHFFENSCYGHPGLDVGSHLADMERFYLKRKKAVQGQYETARQIFLDTYFTDNPTLWIDDLPFFIAHTLLLRLERLLQRPQSKWEPKIDRFLTLCEQLIAASK